ncbi:hypothetical protein SAMN04488056_1158 [Cohaesibacter marisflavi]|uniref:Hpr(Ser) kinase/phosphatase n=1 Tax=Cohaesibacter marisflavi TaxID=655353 RepID=A0A1I5KTB1_9HYPH|nr:hypothetical protein [Cohaesibacter marisflavi]SFO88188.1 hypothetical protein SAMN04488056_1158 [Cohaesibacter marisflavi]
MSLYFDPDHDQANDGPIFDVPDAIASSCPSEIMHAAAIVIGPYGVLLRGGSGSGKSLLQRTIRREAAALSMPSALVSDDYVKLVRLPEPQPQPQPQPQAVPQSGTSEQPELRAYGPVATRGLQEVRGLGIISVGENNFAFDAPMHLLVDLCPADDIHRMPSSEETVRTCLGYPVAHLSVPERSVVEACDLIFALLSTWKEPL